MMKTCLVVSLLFLSLLVSESQGIRLDKGSYILLEQKIIKDVMKTSSNVIVCKDGEECNSEAGNTRKLITNINTSTSTATTVSEKSGHDGGNNGNPTASTVKTSTDKGFGVQQEPLHVNIPDTSSSEQYQEIVDIAEMDYSPARRKPPIHN